MAATEEEWERIFRQRLENYASEPAEDALERILRGSKPPSVEKPGRHMGRRIGMSVAFLGILVLLTVGVREYTASSTRTVAQLPATVKADPKPETEQTGMVAESRPTAGNIPRAGRRIPQNERSAHVIDQPAATLPGLARIRIGESSVLARATEKLRRKPVGSGSDPLRRNDQNTSEKLVNQLSSIPKELPNKAYDVNSTIQSSYPQTNMETETALRYAFVAGKATRLVFPVATLPAVHAPAGQQAPGVEPERLAARPSIFASVMPLYTFREVTPVRQDEVVMEKIRPSTSLSARTGLRVQAGAEWPLNRRLSLRVGAVYQKLQQEMTYSARALRSDSTKVEWVDQQTIKLTPLYKSVEHRVKTTWQYVALSAEGRWQLNPGRMTGLRHLMAIGGSLGYLASGRSGQRWQPFLQASYGVERQLTEKLRLQVEPGIVYNLNAISDNSRSFSVRPYSYGLVIGLHWQP
ncbi:hypothetical protein [Larkinella punicea]|uniref:Outer membrane protein beta-barrel domain-containing protein n=1 Tax=Larkinella punicea TaxID=2315727 RepID=A0A368JI78_9BACT|nr:hypothetical protein [Larkinella punicea]RCR67369.1 hypothetical protein DUE52_21415 [Larkinella punicea]